MRVRIGLSVAFFGLVALNSHADDACLKAYNAAKYEDAATECKVAAAAGDAEAMFRMASLYAVGNGVPHKPEMAVAWLKEAYRRSHEEAGYNLAVAMLQGIGTEQDKLEARLLLTRLAADGYAKAQRELGLLFLEGIAGDKDAETARSLFQAASEQGDIQAKWLLAKFLLERDGVTPQAMSWLTSAAEAGELNAQLQLGAMYEDDQPEKSEHWYRKAVRQGSGMGMYKLAFLLTYGPAKQRNLKLAASLAREAERRHIDFADNLHSQIRQKLQAEVEAARQAVAVQEAAQEQAAKVAYATTAEVETSPAKPSPAKPSNAMASRIEPAQIAAATAAQPLTQPQTQSTGSSKQRGIGAADCTAQAYGREKDACWWQQHSAKNYTLQLGAYRSGASIARYIRNSGLSNALSVTQHCAGGSNLNILTYGIYTSEEQAILARQALPTRVQRQKPWLRTVAGLQKAEPCEATLATR